MGWRSTFVLNAAQWQEKGVKGAPSMAVGSAGRPVVAPGRQVWVAPLPHKQGRMVAVGEKVTWVNVSVEQDQGEAGPGVSSGLQERAKGRETGRWWGTDTRAWAA
jgi:hypothetical protein